MRRLLALCAFLTAMVVTAPANAAVTYYQPNWILVNARVLDILIVPPAHGQVVNGNGALGGSEGGTSEVTPFNSYLRAIEDSVAAWDAAIAAYGSTWLKTLVTNVYVVGRDTIPTSALTDPEIVITTDENKTVILGVAVSTNPCLVDNSKFFITSFTYADMFNINGQEYGHCLGLDHVSGADDFNITHDVMNGVYTESPGTAGTHKHCPSNLNVLGLERSFAAAFGQSPSGGTASMPSTSYATVSC